MEQKKRKRKGERKDGRIQVTFTDGIRANGKPNRISFYGSTRAEAEKKRDQYIREKELGIRSDEREMTVNEWIDKYKETYGLRYYQVHYEKRLRDAIGLHKLKDIREVNLRECLKSVESMSRATVNNYHSFICAVFKKAVQNRYIATNPAAELEKPSGTKGTHRALTEIEIALIMSEHETDVSLAAWLMLLCGLRKAEALALCWDCVDLEKKTLTVKRIISQVGNTEKVRNGSKTKAGIRTVPICDQLAERLSLMFHDGYVIGGNQQPLKLNTFTTMWRKFAEQISKLSTEEPIRSHDLRHTYATMLYDAGIDVKSAQSFLGHSSVSMTIDLYTHLSENKKSSASEQLLKHLNGRF